MCQIYGSEPLSSRYVVVPTFQPLAMLLARQAPSMFYSGTFASKEVQKFMKLTQKMWQDNDPAVILALGLASVSRIAVLGKAATARELQPWRFAGPIQASGSAYLFGTPSAFKAVLARAGVMPDECVPETLETCIVANNFHVGTMYVADKLVEYGGTLLEVFRLLPFLDLATGGLGTTFVLFENSRLSDQTIRVKNILHGEVVNFQVAASEVHLKREGQVLPIYVDDDPLVFGQVLELEVQDDVWQIAATPSRGEEHISYWFRCEWLPNAEFASLPLVLRFRGTPNLLAGTLAIRDEEGSTLFDTQLRNARTQLDNTGLMAFSIDLPEKMAIPHGTVYIAIRVPVPEDSSFSVAIGAFSLVATQTLRLEASLIAPAEGSLFIGAKVRSGDPGNARCLVGGSYVPVKVVREGSFLLIGPLPFDVAIQRQLVVVLPGNTWLESNSVQVISVHRSIAEQPALRWDDAHVKEQNPVRFLYYITGLQALAPGHGTVLTVPLFLGTAFDKRWTVDVLTGGNSLLNIRTRHLVGNGYGNLFLIDIVRSTSLGAESRKSEVVDLEVVVHWDSAGLMLHKSKNLTRIGLFLFLAIIGFWRMRSRAGSV